MQYVRYRYVTPALAIQDFDQATLGAGWLHVLADAKSVLFGSLFLANENDVAPATTANPSGGRADGNKNALGLRAGGQTAAGARTELFANLGLQAGVYDKTNASFLKKRKDNQLDLSVGAKWHWDKNWTLRPQLNYTKNNSNIAIYSFDRADISLTLRRDFR